MVTPLGHGLVSIASQFQLLLELRRRIIRPRNRRRDTWDDYDGLTDDALAVPLTS